MSVGKSSDAVVGSELAGYLIEALIGRGGMGAVYRAEEEGLGSQGRSQGDSPGARRG